jgi:anti-anti-sigma factor
MAVTSHISPDGRTLTISVSGRFDFSVHKDLRKASESVAQPGCNFIVDLEGASYMDSSALGMLLQLREKAGGSKTAVHIRNAGAGIRDILRIANFDKLMTIA